MENRPDMYDFMKMVDDVLDQGATIEEKKRLSNKMIQTIQDMTMAKVGLQEVMERGYIIEPLEDIFAREMEKIEVLSAAQEVAVTKETHTACACSNLIMIKKKGATATGLYCKDCGKWKKWLNKKEIIVHTANGIQLIDHNMEG